MQIQQITTKAIISRNNKVLLLKDQKDVWELPGGRINFGESPESALLRELNEELCARNVKIVSIFDTWDFTVRKDVEIKQIIVLIFECLVKEIEMPDKNDEYKEYGWFDEKEINGLNMRSGYKDSIKKYFNKNKQEYY